MSSLDVRDMLDLPQGGARPAKKIKLAGPRPSGLKGLAREVQSLGGDNPIALVPAVPTFKKRRAISRKPVAKWDLRPFKNSARNDDLILKHWRRQEATAAPVPTPDESETAGESAEKKEEIEDSMFAKYNVQVNIPTYNEAQYESTLKSRDWSKEETDYLMELVKDFDLRWPVIWDRYEYKPAPPSNAEGEAQALVPEPKQRSMEDLKARYYEVAAKMMAVHRKVEHMTQAEFSLHQMMLSFNPGQEALRKRFAEAAMSRSAEERREEEQLLVELKRILARSEQLNEDRRALYNTLESRVSNGNVGIYTTSAGLSQLVQQLANADKSKMKQRKSIMGGPESTPAQTPAQNQDRRESTTTQTAQTPSTNKKGPPGPAERKKLTEEEEAIFGVTHHERLTAGPAFRHDKVAKLTGARSQVVAQRVTNILNELEIPPRLVMPTADVTKEYEALLTGVFKLLDARKLNDKLDSEIKVLEALKAEKERKAREAAGGADKDGEVKKEEAEGSMPAPAAPDSRKRSGSVMSDNSAKRQKK